MATILLDWNKVRTSLALQHKPENFDQALLSEYKFVENHTTYKITGN